MPHNISSPEEPAVQKVGRAQTTNKATSKTNYDILRETVEEHLRKQAVATEKEADSFIGCYVCAPNAPGPSYWTAHAEPEPAPETRPLSESAIEELTQRFLKSYKHPLSATGIELLKAAQGTAQ